MVGAKTSHYDLLEIMGLTYDYTFTFPFFCNSDALRPILPVFTSELLSITDTHNRLRLPSAMTPEVENRSPILFPAKVKGPGQSKLSSPWRVGISLPHC